MNLNQGIEGEQCSRQSKKRYLTISRPRRACYPRGSLSYSLGPHQRGHQGSLSPTFVSAFHALRNTVSPAFVFNPLQRISDAPKLSIGNPCFLIEGVPPQPNYPPDAVLFSKQYKAAKMVLHFCLSASQKMRHKRLPFTLR